MKSKRILRCGGIIFNKQLDSILMVMNKSSFQNKEYKWGFPKGHIKENENPLICAKREI